ncbi:heavy metal translocating P-type ATPase [Acetivibrio cellulolyticus]|uniref:heavy metal translocating P-type ATPase n=1 Tax=Acetivibrio cellulolyticus TaxID=35830 RepID=UPI0001E2D41F|nr:heavy metal translocating P-type ATPase [Acetivibrio cellulolyticus]
MDNKKELILDGLGCASCASKIEDEVRSIKGVKNASVDFVSSKLTIEAENESLLGEISIAVAKVVKNIEVDINVVEPGEGSKIVSPFSMRVNKKIAIKFAAGAILFFTALIFNLPFLLELFLFIASYLILGFDVVVKAYKNIVKGQVFDENFLMSIATIGAFAIGEYPEGVAVMLFYQIGEIFQDMAVNHSRNSIKALFDIRPDYANLKVDGDIRKVSPEEVHIGNLIVVKPGEKVPLDGKIVEGRSVVDASALTGESLPVEVEAGSEILSGVINKNGLITVEVTKEFAQSTVSKILDLVENASSKKAATENFITKFARYYTPAVVIIAALLAVIPPLIIRGASFAEWLNRALVFLVVSCPCALVVSIPLGFFGGIGGASKNGILIKGGNFLEALNSIDTVAFDKTGTLTKGVFKVTEVKPMIGFSKDEVLKFAAYGESFSNHPIAVSIISACKTKIDKGSIENYTEIPGYGLKVSAEAKEILVGNSKLMDMEKIEWTKVDDIGTIIYVAVGGKYAGYIVISDEIKDDSSNTVQALKKMGVRRTIMLTGDNSTTASKIGRELGLDGVYSELLPDQKVERFEDLYKNRLTKGNILYVGDGINDAPVIARADVGIAMGALGSDAAIEAADIVLLTDEPSKLLSAIKIARRTRNIVWQNIVFALSIKALVLIFGAFGIATMWEAVFADVGVALLAVLNSMRAMNAGK